MNKSESIKEIASALAKAQGELKNPSFDANNPHFRSKYASLATVRDTVIPILSKHGLSIAQFPICEDNRAGCETILMHASGEFIASSLLIPVDKLNAHGVGSAQTYSRRYSLMAVCGVVGDEDDDGNGAVGSKPASASKPILAAPISPTTGVWDGITSERAEVARRIGECTIELLESGALDDAYTYLYLENKDAGKIDNDEFVAIWDMLKPYSKQRRALKNMRDDRTGALAATA